MALELNNLKKENESISRELTRLTDYIRDLTAFQMQVVSETPPSPRASFNKSLIAGHKSTMMGFNKRNPPPEPIRADLGLMNSSIDLSKRETRNSSCAPIEEQYHSGNSTIMAIRGGPIVSETPFPKVPMFKNM